MVGDTVEWPYSPCPHQFAWWQSGIGCALGEQEFMPMKRVTVSRRQMLRGGGVVLGLPFLPSLLPGPAYGADATFASPKRFVCLGTPHGAVLAPNRDPADSMAGTKMTLYPGHEIRYGRLTPTTSGGKTSLSPVLTGPSTVFTPALIAKMNVLRGFHIPWYIAHNTGGYLGNFARSDAVVPGVKPMPTIDQLMAWSTRFQPDLTGIRQRSIVTGFDFHGVSWGWSNPQAKSGNVDKIGVINGSSALFDALFGGAKPPTTPSTPNAPKRKPVVDLLLTQYRSLRQSNTRLSTGDKQRLDDHIARLAELERKVTAAPVVSPIACNNSKPSQSSVMTDDAFVAQAECKRRFTLLNDVVAMGLACGASRIATIFSIYPYSDYRGDWHQDVAHQAHTPANQALLTDSNQAMFESMVLDLAAKLDAVQESPGPTSRRISTS
jgi:hypothetical protein